MNPQERNYVLGRLASQYKMLTAEQLKDAQERLANDAESDFSKLLLDHSILTQHQLDIVERKIRQLIDEHHGDIQLILKAVDSVIPGLDMETADAPHDVTVSVPPPRNEQPTNEANHSNFTETIITTSSDLDQEAESLADVLQEAVDHDASKDMLSSFHDEPSKIVQVRLDTLDAPSIPGQQSRYTLTYVCGKGGIGEV